MSPIAIVFLIFAMLVVWGGLVGSALYLRRHPEPKEYPPGGTDDHREDIAPIEHDT